MAAIKLDNVRKSFGKAEIIHGVSIEIDDGAFIVIVGPSGCGKSTLLRMVAGLETITEGEVRIDGRRVNGIEPMDRDIAMVFQNYALYPHMSVFANMAYGLKIARVPRSEIKRRVTTAAEMLQLTSLLDRRPRELSGGQRQRVAMGRAIVRKPKAFLFDEPLSNLDAKLRVQMRLDIKNLQKELGITSLYVTHDQVEAMTLADQMMIMNAGVADQVGEPLAVYSNPKTKFVAGFIGSPATNFLPSSAVGADGTGESTLGIRPEHAHLCPPETGRIRARMTFAEALGAETLLHMRLADGTLFTLRQHGSGVIPDEGSECGIVWEECDQFLFGPDGHRL